VLSFLFLVASPSFDFFLFVYPCVASAGYIVNVCFPLNKIRAVRVG
jgi:hypothetical protein